MANVIPSYQLWAQLLKEFEGFKTNAYLDSGKIPTCGFGSTYNYTAKRKVQMGDTVTYGEAITWMQDEFQEVVRLANIYVKKSLNTGQSTAICDYIYNRGIGNFLKTQIDELINANPNDPRILAQIKGTGLWDRMGHLLRGLQRRRDSEAYMYQTGQAKFDF